MPDAVQGDVDTRRKPSPPSLPTAVAATARPRSRGFASGDTMMRARSVTGGLAAVLLVVTACGGDEPARAPVGDPAAEESAAVTEPVEPPPHDDAGARFDPALFGADSATIHNQWWPHIPGMQYVYEGQARDG